MALAMKVISQVEAQRKILEEAVSTALELASGKSDGAEVAVSKTTGISVSTRYGEVENVEFNSDGALGITVYHQNRKGSASSTDLSPQAIARTVQAALDIARYTSPDPYAGVADKELLAFDAPDLDLFHPADVSPDEAIELAARAEQAALQADKRITNTEGGSFNSHYGVKVFGNSHGMLQGYCSTRHSLSSCVIAEENGDMERDYAYTIGRSMSDLQTPEWVGADCARRTLSRLSPRKLSTMKAPVIFAIYTIRQRRCAHRAPRYRQRWHPDSVAADQLFGAQIGAEKHRTCGRYSQLAHCRTRSKLRADAQRDGHWAGGDGIDGPGRECHYR